MSIQVVRTYKQVMHARALEQDTTHHNVLKHYPLVKSNYYLSIINLHLNVIQLTGIPKHNL